MQKFLILIFLVVFSACGIENGECIDSDLEDCVMLSEGPNNPATAANNASYGSVVWINTGEIFVNDDLPSQSGSLTVETTQYLTATNFSFNIPPNAAILGILVEIRKKKASAGNNIVDSRVRIIKNGAIGSTDKALGQWSSSYAYSSYGSSSDVWNEAWQADDINASDFGVAISAFGAGTPFIDHIRMTIFYGLPGDLSQGFGLF